jgi:hypothetical protein
MLTKEACENSISLSDLGAQAEFYNPNEGGWKSKALGGAGALSNFNNFSLITVANSSKVFHSS